MYDVHVRTEREAHVVVVVVFEEGRKMLRERTARIELEGVAVGV